MTTNARPRDASAVAKGIPRSLTGAHAVAQAMRQTNPDVVAAYPITPSTVMVEAFSAMVANREVDTEFIAVESEHSALSACIGAAAAVRAQTVTSSQGLALMWELLPVAAGLRLPIVLHCANRALSAPINIHCDHSDTMGARDSGWLQLYAENPQEAYDHALISVRIAEHPDVLLPVLHSQDGYAVTHSAERVELLPDASAREFVGEYTPAQSLLDTSRPFTLGPIVGPDYFFEVKRQTVEAMTRALGVIPELFQEFGHLSGRSYHLVEEESLEDAELALVALGSTVGTLRTVVRDLRRQGVNVGLLEVRCFRPFPSAEVARALRHCQAVGVLDRCISFGGAGNPLYLDVLASLSGEPRPPLLASYSYGLGGRALRPREVVEVFARLARVAASGVVDRGVSYIGLRE